MFDPTTPDPPDGSGSIKFYEWKNDEFIIVFAAQWAADEWRILGI